MPKNVLNPQSYAGGLAPPVPEQSILFDRTRQTALQGYTPPDSVGAGAWQNSVWFKQTGDLGSASRCLWSAYVDANNFTRLDINSVGNITFQAQVAGVTEASFNTNRRMMDTSAWYHISVIFIPSLKLELIVNGQVWTEWAGGGAPTVSNIAGYAWLDQNADHIIGAFGTPSDWFSGNMAEFVCNSGLTYLPSSFGVINAQGQYSYKAFTDTIDNNGRGFLLTFGRTVDLGEDFSGNANDFPTHTNGAASGGDQFDDWPERNYCIIDVNDDETVGTLTEGALELVGGPDVGRVTMKPAAGDWYYEKDGVGVVWETGVSGRFDPLLTQGVYNFGQKPWDDVGPSGGELALCSPNMPAHNIPISRDFFSAIGFEGNGVNPRSIISPLPSQGDPEYNQISHRADLVWIKNMTSNSAPQWQSHRLRAFPNMLAKNTNGTEESAPVQGFVSDMFAIAGFEVDAGGSGDDNVNNLNDLISAVAWRSERFAENQVVTSNDESDAEEFLIDGDTDTGSSDLELGSEDGSPGAAEQAVGMQWKNLRIPQGATVNGAYVQFECDAARNDQPNDLEIWCEDIDDAPEFVDGAANFNITGRTKTSASVLWSPPAWAVTQERGDDQRTPDIATAVKEVVDRGGWAPGNDMAVIIEPETPGSNVGRHEAESGNAGTPSDANGPMLQVAWQVSTFDPGLSLFTYDGVGKVATYLHGLQAVPDILCIKNADATDSWRMYHSQIQPPDLPSPEDGYIGFNLAGGAVDSLVTWNDTPPTFDRFTLGTSAALNTHDEQYVGWAMREIEGFSKVFNYIGNGASLGEFIYCNFKPRMIVIKETGPGGNGWFFGHRAMGLSSPGNGIHNQMSGNMLINSTTGALQDDNLFIGSNGFRIIDSTGAINNTNSRYVGFAFAECPWQYAKAAT